MKDARPAAPPGWLFAAVIFVAAFLLFQVQPMIGRIVLPLFGGSSAVWATCLFFFQAALLAGYLYADVAARRLAPRRLLPVHAAVLAATLLALPLSPAAAQRFADAGRPVAGILLLLAATVGAPYFVLATTSPLVQAWSAARAPGGRPYRLYAWSNAGSLLGLLSYPFLVEPFFPLRVQALAWSALYALCAAAIVFLAAASLRGRPSAAPAPASAARTAAPPAPASPWADLLLWAALAATATTLLVAVTNHLTQNIAPFPFLWVLPLTLYLVSFIVCFAAEGRYYARRAWLALAVPALLAVPYLLTASGPVKAAWLIPAYCAILFVCCMVCHGELHRSRPPAARLTVFYLMVALGGAAGGFFVGLAAPALFNGEYELHAGVASCAALLAALLVREARAGGDGAAARRALAAGAVALLAGLAGWLGYAIRDDQRSYTIQRRNFYGVLRVREQEAEQPAVARRTLAHGSVIHGVQWLHPFRAAQPTAYFGPGSGAGLALLGLGPAPARVGVVGLGIGTLAAYGRPGDLYRFYEINPTVTELARSQFSFLGGSAAQVEVVHGDGRLALAGEPDQRYDVLVLDAFSGDAIPVHLLTREAFAGYFRHLGPDGLIAVNCSNLYLDIPEAVVQVATSLGRSAIVVENPADEFNLINHAVWVLVAAEPRRFLRAPFSGRFPLARAKPGATPWSDDYSNLFRILKLRG